VLGFLLCSGVWANEARDPMQYFFDQNFGNLQDEAATARKEQKLGVLIMFETADCPWCEKMMTTVLNQPAIQDYYRKYFRILQVDTNGDVPLVDFAGKDMTQKDFAFKHNRVRATPVFAFFDLDGHALTKYTGATVDAQEFTWLGEFVVSGAYKNDNFTAYKRERLAAGKK
jgi:thioredoxin-related protein